MKLQSLLLSPLLLAPWFAQAGPDETDFARYDANRDETVTYLEFASKKKQEFEQVDRDRSRTLSAAEFEALAPAQPMDLFVLPAFAELDADTNEQVDFREFGGAVKSVFDKLDAGTSGTGDKKVVKGEYLAALQRKEAGQKATAAAAVANKGSKKGSDTKKPATPPAK